MSLLAAIVYQPGAKPTLAVDSMCGSGCVLMMTHAQFLRPSECVLVSFA